MGPKESRFCRGAMEIAPATAENRPIVVHSGTGPTKESSHGLVDAQEVKRLLFTYRRWIDRRNLVNNLLVSVGRETLNTLQSERERERATER